MYLLLSPSRQFPGCTKLTMHIFIMHTNSSNCIYATRIYYIFTQCPMLPQVNGFGVDIFHWDQSPLQFSLAHNRVKCTTQLSSS